MIMTQIYVNFLYFLLRFWSLFPLSFLYIVLGNFLTFFLFVFGYRKKVIDENLKLIFPDWDRKKILKTRKKYYRRLAELIVEIIKMTDFSLQELRNRIHVKNPELLKNAVNKNQKIVFLTAHYVNWEWMIVIPITFGMKTYAVYQPLENAVWDRVLRKIRGKFGAEPIAISQVARMFLSGNKQEKSTAYCILIDQSPGKDHPYYTHFLEQEVPFYHGIEKMIQKFNWTCFYPRYRIVKKGYLELEILELNPEHLIEQYKTNLEQDIYNFPEFWLLSHRRFKHKK